MPHTTVDKIVSLGHQINNNHYQIVWLAARYDTELDWLNEGFSSASLAISKALDIHTSTAREWVRVGHSLNHLPQINRAFATNQLSYAKARILTRWADPDNETELLDLANEFTANRLTTQIAKHLAKDETKTERDQRHHDQRSVTIRTDGNGMTIIHAALPPSIGKPIAETLNTLVKHIAATPAESPATDTSADASRPQRAQPDNAKTAPKASADASRPSLRQQIQRLKDRWQTASDEPFIPTLAQQRADALALLF